MAIIIDANCLSNVFEKKSTLHHEFSPVFDWIISGKGKMVVGGTKYFNELKKLTRILRLFNILKNSNKVVIVNTDQVDCEQARLEAMINHPDFDDPHIMALVIVSSCRLVCSRDARSEAFILDGKYYPKGVKPPKFYKGRRNQNLLCDKYIPDKFKPLSKLNKEERERINKL